MENKENKVLLVVDDDKDIVQTLKGRLSKEGYQVLTAFDGQEALKSVEESDPDIILLDLMMPKINGFEVLKQVRGKYSKKWRPVIVISSQTELEAVKECYKLEADQYLTKPVTLEKVLQGIETMKSLIPIRRAKNE